MLEEGGLNGTKFSFPRSIKNWNPILIHISPGQADENHEYCYKPKRLISMLLGGADSTAVIAWSFHHSTCHHLYKTFETGQIDQVIS
jgi:hypothetical protein